MPTPCSWSARRSGRTEILRHAAPHGAWRMRPSVPPLFCGPRAQFRVANSRARDRAELVTDDAWKLADRLEQATGERLAALDATAKQAARETVFGRDADREGKRDPLLTGTAFGPPDRRPCPGRGRRTGLPPCRAPGGQVLPRGAPAPMNGGSHHRLFLHGLELWRQ